MIHVLTLKSTPKGKKSILRLLVAYGSAMKASNNQDCVQDTTSRSEKRASLDKML